jgi:hypothetical protein
MFHVERRQIVLHSFSAPPVNHNNKMMRTMTNKGQIVARRRKRRGDQQQQLPHPDLPQYADPSLAPRRLLMPDAILHYHDVLAEFMSYRDKI